MRVLRNGGRVLASKGWARRQEDEKQTEGAILRGAVEGHAELFALPVAEAVRADEDGAGGADAEPVGKFLLPVAARRKTPFVEPRLETRPFQFLGDALNGRLVAAVV